MRPRARARDSAALDHEVDEAGALEDRPHETAVLEVVGGEGEPVGLVELADRVEPASVRAPVRLPIGRDELVAPEELAGDRPEALVLESPERGAVSFDAVQHYPPRDARGRHRPVEDARPPTVPAKGEVDAVQAAARLEEAQIEAGDVPADDEVRVVVRDPGEEGVQDRGLVGEMVDRGRAAAGRKTEERWPVRRSGLGVDEKDGLHWFVTGWPPISCFRFRFRLRSRGRALAGRGRFRPGPRVRAAHRDRPELLLGVVSVEPGGLDVERHGAKARAGVAGPHPGVDVLDETLAALRPAVEHHRPGDEAFHQEPVGGPHVGFEYLRPGPLSKRFEGPPGMEVEGIDGHPAEGREGDLAAPHARGRGAGSRHEADRLLAAEHRSHRAVRAACPQHQLEPPRRVARVAGEEKDFRRRLHGPAASPASHRPGRRLRPSCAPAAPRQGRRVGGRTGGLRPRRKL